MSVVRLEFLLKRNDRAVGIDANGDIWVADPVGHCVVLVREGGEVLDKRELDRGAYACALGGEDGHTLFVATATNSGPESAVRLEGRIETTQVAVPAADF